MLINKLFTGIICLMTVMIAHGQSIKLMTYNIRLDVSSDGENDWNHRKDFLVSQIQFYSPDIFGTQEGLPHQIDYIYKCLKHYKYLGSGRESESKGESTSVFYDTTKFVVKFHETFWLSTTPNQVSKGWDASYIRICTYALFQCKLTNQEFWVFNTHLDNDGEIARIKGIDLILNKMHEANIRNLPVLFMGDFNSTPDTELIKNLKNEMLDSKEISDSKPFGPDETFNNFEFHKPADMLIDYIFVSKSPRPTVLKYSVLTDSKNCRYPSDHFPILVELRF